ncbi:MAG: hypothetical protein Q8M12_01685, partial [bacterium]|nr:hypothetical protein [bacterium]
MKKTSLVVIVAIVAMMSVGFAGVGLAQDDVSVDVNNTNTNTVSGVNTQDQQQQQQQQQQQTQQQQAVGGNAEVNYNSPGVVVAPVALAGVVGGHPGSPAVVMNGGWDNNGSRGVVGGHSMAVGGTLQSAMPGWTPFVCRPLFQVYDEERIEASAVDSSFGHRKGGFFHRMGHDDSSDVPHISSSGKPSGKPVTILDWEPAGTKIHPGDKLLGEFECEGDYGQPQGAALGRCIKEATQKYPETTRISAYYKVRRDPKNSGMSLGSGAAAGGMLGNTAGVISLGGLIGTTSAYVDEAVDWYILALNDGPNEAPEGADLCGEQITTTTTTLIVQTPQGVCDPRPIIIRIEELKRKVVECKLYCFNNLTLRRALVEAYIDLYVCTGNREYLRNAIENAEIAER